MISRTRTRIAPGFPGAPAVQFTGKYLLVLRSMFHSNTKGYSFFWRRGCRRTRVNHPFHYCTLNNEISHSSSYCTVVIGPRNGSAVVRELNKHFLLTFQSYRKYLNSPPSPSTSYSAPPPAPRTLANALSTSAFRDI